MKYRKLRKSWLDKQYHRGQHVKHSAISAWHIALGAIVVTVILICVCG